MGKWESVTRLLKDLGAVQGGTNNDFRYTRYEIQPNTHGDVTGFCFTLGPEEVKRRSKTSNPSDTEVEFTASEVTDQVKNVEKWRNLNVAAGFLKDVIIGELRNLDDASKTLDTQKV